MVKNKKYHIPDITQKRDNKKISDAVANHPVSDQGFYTISFSKYKTKDCELQNLKSGSYKKALTWVKRVCLCSSFDEIRQLGRGDSIDNSGSYSFLFNNDLEDAEIKEYKLVDTDRIFYYIDDAFRQIHIVLIKNSHLETKKNKR